MDLRDLKKDNLVILQLWRVRMKIMYCPFPQSGLGNGRNVFVEK